MKSKYLRENIRDVHMRSVIVRLDFAYDGEFKKLIEIFNESFIKLFKEGPNSIKNHDIQISLRDKDIASISKNLSIPVESVRNMEFFRYEGFKNCACEAFLDISPCYMCLNIKCKGNNYDGLTKYIEPVKGFISILSKKSSNFIPIRLGIRKVRGQVFSQYEEIGGVFESFVFPECPLITNKQRTLKREYIDIFQEVDSDFRYNVRKEIGYMVNDTNEPLYSTILDIDTYFHIDKARHRNINDMLRIANEKEFEVYKECMIEPYLESIYEKTKR